MRSLLGGVLFFALCASPAHAAPILWSDNGHYYDFIIGSRTWAQALTRAGELTFDFDGVGGQPAVSGYLVTITSPNEQAFLNQHFGNSGLYWIAAGDGAVEAAVREGQASAEVDGMKAELLLVGAEVTSQLAISLLVQGGAVEGDDLRERAFALGPEQAGKLPAAAA